MHKAVLDCRARIDELIVDGVRSSEWQRAAVDAPVVSLPPKLSPDAPPTPSSPKEDLIVHPLTAAKVKPEFHLVETAPRQDVQLKRGDDKSADLWQHGRCVVCRAEIDSTAEWEKHAATAPHERRVRVSAFLKLTDAYEWREGCQPNAVALRDGSVHYLGKECMMEFQDGYGAYLLWSCYVCCVAGISHNGILEHMKSSHHQLAYMKEFHSEWTPTGHKPKQLVEELDELRKNNKFGLKCKPRVVRLLIDPARVFAYLELTLDPSKAATAAATAERPNILHDTPTAVILWCESCWEAVIITKASQCFDDVWTPHLQMESHAQAKQMRQTLASLNRSSLLGAHEAFVKLSRPEGAGGWAWVDGEWRYKGGSRYLGVEHLVERYAEMEPDVVCLLCAAVTPLLPEAVVAHVTSERHILHYLQYELRDDATALSELGAARESAPTLHGWVNRFLCADAQEKGRRDQGALAVFDPRNARRYFRWRVTVNQKLFSKVNLARRPPPRPLIPQMADDTGIADMEIDEDVCPVRLNDRQAALVTMQQLNVVARWRPMDADVADALQAELGACEEPLVGLETVKAVYQDLALKCYLCDSCQSLHTASSLVSHLCSFDHRLAYKETGNCSWKLPPTSQRTEIEALFDKEESLQLAKSYLKGWARLVDVETRFTTPRHVTKRINYAGPTDGLDKAIAVSQLSEFIDDKYKPQVSETMQLVVQKLRMAKKEKIPVDTSAKCSRAQAALCRLRADIKVASDEPLLAFDACETIYEVCSADDRHNLWRCYYCDRCKALMRSVAVVAHLKSEQHRLVCFGLWARRDNAAKDSARLYLLSRRIVATLPGGARAKLLRDWAQLLQAETRARRDVVLRRRRYVGSRSDLRHELHASSTEAQVWICDPCGHINWHGTGGSTSESRCDLCEAAQQRLGRLPPPLLVDGADSTRSADNPSTCTAWIGGSPKKQPALVVVDDVPSSMSVVVTAMLNMCGTVVKVVPGKQATNGLLISFSDADGVLTALSLLPGWRVKPHHKPLVVKVPPTTRDYLVCYINAARRGGLTNLKYYERMQPTILAQRQLRATLLDMSSTAKVDTIVPPDGSLKRLGAEMTTAGEGGSCAQAPMPPPTDNAPAVFDYGQSGLLAATKDIVQLPVSDSMALADLSNGGQQQQRRCTSGLAMQTQAFGNQVPFGLDSDAPPLPIAYKMGAVGLDPGVAAVLEAPQLQVGSPQPPPPPPPSPPSTLESSAYSSGVGPMMMSEQEEEHERLAARQAQLAEQRKMLAEEEERLRVDRERYLAEQRAHAIAAERAASQDKLREEVAQEQRRRDALRHELLSLLADAPSPQPAASTSPIVEAGCVRNEASIVAEELELVVAAALQSYPPKNAEDLVLAQRIISKSRPTGGSGGGSMGAQSSAGVDSAGITDVEPGTTSKARRLDESRKAAERQAVSRSRSRDRRRLASRSPSRKRNRRSKSRHARPTEPPVDSGTGVIADGTEAKSLPTPVVAQAPATMQTPEKRGAAPIAGFAAASCSSATASETLLMELLERERDASRQREAQRQALLDMLAQVFSGQPPPPPAQPVAPQPSGHSYSSHDARRGAGW